LKTAPSGPNAGNFLQETIQADASPGLKPATP
jgi:hypothetical protein